MRPLSAAHFKTAGAESISTHPLVEKLAAKLVEAIPAALATFGAAAPRVTLDAVSSGTVPDDGATALRFESQTGSLLARIALDRTMVFAMCEQALGGTGTEEPIADSGRPLSGIETELHKAIISAIAVAACSELSQILATPFSLLEDIETDGAAGLSVSHTCVHFRYLVNIFSYSSEVRLCLSETDLALHTGAASKPLDHGRASVETRDLQRQIAGATAEFKITLEPELAEVGDIIALRPGSLLRLATAMTTPVIVSSGGIAVFTATLDHSGGRLAVRLIEPAG